MAMNKREKAAFDQLAILAALRWTPKIMPDIPVPTEGHTQGWRASVSTSPNGDAVAVVDGSCRRAWSEPKQNGYGKHTEVSHLLVCSWRGIPLYSTKALALKALRHELECEYAANLKRIDDRIKALEAEDGS